MNLNSDFYSPLELQAQNIFKHFFLEVLQIRPSFLELYKKILSNPLQNNYNQFTWNYLIRILHASYKVITINLILLQILFDSGL